MTTTSRSLHRLASRETIALVCRGDYYTTQTRLDLGRAILRTYSQADLDGALELGASAVRVPNTAIIILSA